jgi:predicted phosphohydrolase
VALADTHGEHRNIPYIPDGDVFVYAGDFLNYGDESIIGDFSMWLDHLPHLHKILIGGNHDWFLYYNPGRIKDLPDCHYLEDSSIMIGDLKFYGSPWVPHLVGIGAFSRGRGTDIWEKWQFIPDDTDVLVTHAAPFGVGDKVMNSANHVGCKDLISRVEEVEPKVHIFGHVHGSGGFQKQRDSTFFANVSYTKNFNNKATIIDI